MGLVVRAVQQLVVTNVAETSVYVFVVTDWKTKLSSLTTEIVSTDYFWFVELLRYGVVVDVNRYFKQLLVNRTELAVTTEQLSHQNTVKMLNSGFKHFWSDRIVAIVSKATLITDMVVCIEPIVVKITMTVMGTTETHGLVVSFRHFIKGIELRLQTVSGKAEVVLVVITVLRVVSGMRHLVLWDVSISILLKNRLVQAVVVLLVAVLSAKSSKRGFHN